MGQWNGQHVVSYAISQGNIVNVVACETRPVIDDRAWEGPWVIDCPQSEMLECFADWEPDVLELLKVKSQLSYFYKLFQITYIAINSVLSNRPGGLSTI